MNKKAFTFIEILIVIMIIGIIATVEMMTVIKSSDITYKYTYIKLYNALKTTIYNYMTHERTDERTNSTFPASSEDFCKALISYMNTAKNSTEKNNNCSASKNITSTNPTDSDFTDENVQMVLSNGVKIWIGANTKDSPESVEYYTYTEPEKNYSVKYYLVFADLNGNRKPNTISKEGRKYPDIVAYAVTDKYDVIPLGLPTVDRKYLTAYMTYMDTANDEEEYEANDKSSEAMTYYEAKVEAYGTYKEDGSLEPNRIVTEGVMHSYDFEHSVFDEGSPFRIDNPANFISTTPIFDKKNCLNDNELDNPNIEESYCEVKIYDYN